MKKPKNNDRDPRMETPPGYYFQHTDWLPEENSRTSFFSLRDTMFFFFLIAACLLVAIILWLKPPKIISFDTMHEPKNEAILSSENLPKQLRKHPSFNPTQFEEISDDDPLITGEEVDFPQPNSIEEKPLPPTLKSGLKRFIDFILASLHLPIHI